MTENKRYTIPIPPDMEAQIIELRKTDEFCALSFAEIIRRLMAVGLDAQKTTTHNRPTM